MTPYAELHCHSAYSFLDGASMPDELVSAALEHGYRSLALTDHNGVSGSMEFAQAARAQGLHAIHGAELDVVVPGQPDPRHLVLLVRDGRGWSNLANLLTLAHAHTRERRPGPPSPAHVPLDAVCDRAEGLVCLTGCAGQGIHDEPSVARLRDAFGREGLRVELQRPFWPGDRARNRALARLASRLELACVATGNVHAHHRRRAELQDALVAVRTHTTLEASEPRRRGNFSHVMCSPAAIAHRFADHPEAVAETSRLAAQLRFELHRDLGYRYPGADDEAAQRRLAERCSARMDDRYPPTHPHRSEARGRLEEELRIIDALGLAGFFLLHQDMLELAHEVAVEVRGRDGLDSPRSLLAPGRGRGSSVSSLVCYLIGLSHIDPVANRLLLGRFLNEELVSLPDIDLDFPRDIREALIPRVHERYGRDRSALVAAFPTYRSRGAIRELGKVLGLPAGDIERVARGAEPFGADVNADIGAAGVRRSVRWEWLARLSAEAQGLPRHLSQHSGGMVVATRPLIDCCPVVPAAMPERQIVQWDKDSCADAGFLKIDLLGLGMLSAVERAVELVARQRHEQIDLSRIPYDDPDTFAAVQVADTVGVFQIESRAQMQSLRRTRPRTLDDIVIQVAIVRPGPIQGGAVNPYIARLQRLRADPSFPIPYEHPSLEGPLAETLGTIIFQDQVIEVAQAFAGFSPGQAEGLRRAMSRRRSETAMRAYEQRFIAGAQEHVGADEEVARAVWEKVRGFAGFGFPKAHSAAFGLLAYQSTWLRVHFGPEFLCALLNEQPMGFYPPDSLVHEAQRRGIRVAGADVNASEIDCTVQGRPGRAPEQVRIGLGYVSGVRRDEVAALIAARQEGGPFASVADLAARAGAGRGALEQLAWSGACDSLGATPGQRPGDRRAALWQLGVAMPARPAPAGTQLALALELPPTPSLRTLDRWELLVADYASTGVTVSDHALAILRPRLEAAGVAISPELETRPHRSRVRVGGMVVARQRPATAGGIVFLLLEDEHGAMNVVVRPEVYERHRALVRTEPLLVIDGTLERPPAGGGVINVLARDILPLQRLAESGPAAEVVSLEEERDAVRSRAAEEAAEAAALRAVAPSVQSFAAGRRR